MGRALFVFALLGAVSVANAGLIDNFNTGASSVTTNSTTPQAYTSAVAAGVPGGTRYLGQNYNGPVSRNAAATVDAFNGAFNVSTPFGAETITALAYGNITAPVTGGNAPDWFIDTTKPNLGVGGDTLRLNFNGNEQKLFVTVFLNSELGLTSYAKTISGNQFTPFSVDITAGDLVGSAPGTTFNNFDSLLIRFGSTNSGDFELGSVEAVPEPASIAALAVGAVALLRRRKNS